MVDGKTDQKEILNIFKNKYRAILDDPFSQTRPKKYDNILEKINNETHINNCKLYSKDINYAINKLKVGIGFDLVHSQHLKNVNNAYRNLLRDFSQHLLVIIIYRKNFYTEKLDY